MSPSISIRESIRWLPDEASEPTRTLVLTSAQHRFVDIRIIRPPPNYDTEESKEDVLPLSRLDWAFAGTSHTVPTKDADSKPIMHSVWKHWVDSRHRDVEGVSDEGDMIPLPEGRTLEKGSMKNPATGKVGEYEEIWQDIEPVATDKTGNQDEGKRSLLVLTLSDPDHEARGMVIRLGQFCQGVLRVGSHFALERWAWEQGKGWRREVRMGNLLVPAGIVVDEAPEGVLEKEWKEGKGGKVKYGEYEWKVVECGSF